jgi:serine/threonine protein kinase/Tfp pilus assembly protein PilF
MTSIRGSTDRPVPVLGLPDVGDEIFGFRLQRELGRGAFARVFLATQKNLAGRPVVLKVSAIEGNEPQTLAQLQHTHIVPIHSVHEDSRAGLRAVCMPFFGGASLSQVLRHLWGSGSLPATGAALVDSLTAVQAKVTASESASETAPATAASRSAEPNTGVTPLSKLRNLSYVRASAWLIACLADALEHAHHRGILHRDIKPSNILVSSEGQPLLLDFNLAQADEGSAGQAVLGGTVAYMAPEHLRALACRNPAAARQVDRRADIYALGMVLYEMLTGHSPFDQSASYSVVPMILEAMAVERSQTIPSVRQLRKDVPWALESIVRKCLAPHPANRYQSAEQLAEDLRRFLEDRPLGYAPELSRRERIEKWFRRHPRLTSSGSVAAAAVLLLIAAGAIVAGVQRHLTAATTELHLTQARERRQTYEDATVRALCYVNTTSDLREHLPLGAKLCEDTLGLYDVLGNDNWQEGENWQRLDTEEKRRLSEDTRELLLLLASARVRLNPSDPDTARQALSLLERADGIRDLEPCKALDLDRASYLERLGRNNEARPLRQQADQLQPASARDHYLLSIAYVRQGGPDAYPSALRELDRAITLNPRLYWAWLQRGICHQEMGDYTLATQDFATCVGLWPDFAWGHFNLGYVLGQSGRRQEAIDEYTRALSCDSTCTLALVNRGLAQLELKQHRAALEDFDDALGHGHDDAAIHAGRGVALEALERTAEADAAFATAIARLDDATEAVQARIHAVHGLAIAARQPDPARHEFARALRIDRSNPQALLGMAQLAETTDRGEALRFLDRALEADSRFLEARRYRALLGARAGRLESAGKDINSCLEQERTPTADTLYVAACVAARVMDKFPTERTTEQALSLLEKALTQGYPADRASRDVDLGAIRKHPEFKRLLARRTVRADSAPHNTTDKLPLSSTILARWVGSMPAR